MNKRFLVLLIAVTLAGNIAQAQINQADKLYKSYSYSLAIPQYLKIAQKSGDPDRNYAIVRLADCYRLVNDQVNAKAWYAKAVTLPNTENINWFYYGEALRCAQEYDLANEAYQTYDSLNPDDPRGKAYAAFCAQVPKLSDIPAGYEIRNVREINSESSDFGPAFYNDGIVFVSDRRQNFMDNNKYDWTSNNYLDLFFTTPKYLDEFYQEMNEPKSFSQKFNQTFHDGPASFARHDSLIYLTRTDKGKEKKDVDNFRTDRLKIFWSKYNGSWSKTEPFFMNSDDYSVGHPILTPDGNTIYFVSDMPGGIGGTDIYTCKWEGSNWSQPRNLGSAVNSFGDEMFPSVSSKTLYFSSNGFAGFGGLDLFRSTLANDGTWSKAENLGQPINSSFDDFAFVIDARSKKGFFSSNRPGGVGSDDIYAFRQIVSQPKKELTVKKDTLSMMLSGFVKDKQTMKPMPGCTVFLLNTQNDKVRVLKTDANGRFQDTITKGIFYVTKAMENNYLSDCLNFKFETADTAHKGNTPRDLLLDVLEVNKIFSVNNMDYAIETIYYDFDKWFIRPDAAMELDKLVQVMKENPVLVELGSHTDSRGSKEYNLDLSQKRAEAAVRYIVLKGIDAARITARGYGESQLINHCSDGIYCSDAEHQANRRTEFKVTGFTNAEANSNYDMSKFKGNEEIPAYMFDRDFFINCLQDKKMEKYTSEPESMSTSIKGESNLHQDVYVPAVEQDQATYNSNNVETGKAAVSKKARETVNSNPGAVSYRVQILALSREKSLLDPEFEQFNDVQMYLEDGLFKYTTGVFNTHEEALNYRSQVVRTGYSDAFVVTFSNGKRIYVGPAN